MVALAAAVSTAPAAAAPAANLSITLTDAAQQVTSEQDVTYVATVTNGGGERFAGRLVVDLPAYARVDDAHRGRVGKHAVTWNVRIAAGKSISRTVDVHLGRIPKGDVRVTTLASLFQQGGSKTLPLIRTADADRIAGVKDPARTITSAPGAAKPGAGSGSTGGDGTNWWLVAGLPAGALVVLLGAGALARRRRRAVRDGHEAAPDARADLVDAGTGAGERGGP